MPELPDLTAYLEAIEEHLTEQPLQSMQVKSAFILRSVSPNVDAFTNRRLLRTRRIGKRLILEFEDQYFVMIHLMIAGRLRWYPSGTKVPTKIGLIELTFPTGSLLLTEAGKKHRASVHLVQGLEDLMRFDAGGLEVFHVTFDEFKQALSKNNHTLKRALTDQKILAGIGNAYSDEILLTARISPMRQIKYLDEAQWQRLFDSTIKVLTDWTTKLRLERNGHFPAKVTAFHKDMSVHGKYKQPCPLCQQPVQRIRYATNECNYCAKCQNQGKLLADRSLSRLLKKDWPKTLEELDQLSPTKTP